MRKLIPLLAALLISSVAARADSTQAITNLESLLNQLGVGYSVVDTFDRANSTPGKVQNPPGSYYGIVTITFQATDPANVYNGYPYSHPASNGALTPGSWSGGGSYYMLYNSDTGLPILLAKNQMGQFKKFQIKSDCSSVLFFDTNGYSYKCTVSYNVGQDAVSFEMIPTVVN